MGTQPVQGKVTCPGSEPGSQPRESLISGLAFSTTLYEDWLVSAQRGGKSLLFPNTYYVPGPVLGTLHMVHHHVLSRPCEVELVVFPFSR